jgi:hypothetical protein
MTVVLDLAHHYAEIFRPNFSTGCHKFDKPENHAKIVGLRNVNRPNCWLAHRSLSPSKR